MNKDFTKSILSLRGKVKGQRWLDNIPELVKTYENKWGLKSQGTFPDLSINFVEKVEKILRFCPKIWKNFEKVHL